MCYILKYNMQFRSEFFAMETLDARRCLYRSRIGCGGGRSLLVGAELQCAHEGGQVRREIGMRGCDGFVEGDFGLRAGFYYYGAGWVGEHAVTGGHG
jgi:hypothetical protein